VRIALCGKYVDLKDAYKSVAESLLLAGVEHGAKVDILWVDSETIQPDVVEDLLATADGIPRARGFGSRGIDGKLLAVKFAREHGVPYLGICLGLQVAAMEFARNVLGLAEAGSSEFQPECAEPVIDLLPSSARSWTRGQRCGSVRTRVRARAGLEGGPRVRHADGLRAPSPPLRVQQALRSRSKKRVSCSRDAGPRRGSWRSWSCLLIRGSCAANSIPSSARVRAGRIRCSPDSSGPRWSTRRVAPTTTRKKRRHPRNDMIR
jgi:hypothetical protein